MARDRRIRRFQADCPAELLVPKLAPVAALAIDLSPGGTFLETDAGLPLGLRVKVRLLPPGRPPLVLVGKVLRFGSIDRRVKHPELEYLTVRCRGIAVKFDALEGQSERLMESYLATLPPIESRR